LEFARGRIEPVFGPDWALADTFPSRVRLPDEPLMLVDRVVLIEGKPRSLEPGRMVTEHDVREGAWYLDGGRMTPGVSIESGQADLMLSAWLGVDFATQGRSLYRLLDAEVTYHRPPPAPGDRCRYDIRILKFFRHADTWMFRFEYDGTVNGEPLMSMRKGCAGFFTPDALDAGKGLSVPAPEGGAGSVEPGLVSDPSENPPRELGQRELDLVRSGDLSPFGPRFRDLGAPGFPFLPGGNLALVHRADSIDRAGGAWKSGFIRARADVDPRAWYLKCHFPGDEVMPGTLMFDASLQALKLYLMSVGWIPGPGRGFVPAAGLPAALKCRGQVTAATREVCYDVHVRELSLNAPAPEPSSGRRPGRPAKRAPEPTAVADAVMWADGRPIVEVTGMSLALSGGSLEQLSSQFREKRHKGRPPSSGAKAAQAPPARDGGDGRDQAAAPGAAAKPRAQRSPDGSGSGPENGGATDSGGRAADGSGLARAAGGNDAGGSGLAAAASGRAGNGQAAAGQRLAPGTSLYVYPREQVKLLSSGPVSGAFGPLFSRFDSGAFFPHLPKAPYDFLDEVEVVEGEVGVVADGSELVARHLMDPSRWTFAEAGGDMALPYAAINETALQPCGFLASFMGSYLPFPGPMHFRNLGGEAVTLKAVTPDGAGLAETRASLERHSVLGETAIQHYKFSTSVDGEAVYRGITHFGFLSPENLARQEGLKLQRGEDAFPGPPEGAASQGYPRGPAWPAGRWRMLDRLLWDRDPDRSPPGWCWGSTLVRPGAWFFAAHFPQDPVWPGSLGLEAFYQAAKVLALKRFYPGEALKDTRARFTAPVPGRPHRWLYRGQIVPVSRGCAIGLQVTEADDALKILAFKGVLWADDLPIYRVDDFTVQVHGL
jgi:3-hydroxymyristoyl/3-hydroxydecanoyl-(acyl carrier protein) dehydratase